MIRARTHYTQTSVFGGNGGANFSDTEFQSGVRITEVRVYTGNYVDAVQLGYEYQDGRTVAGLRRGGPGGRENVFRLDRDEYITGISGRYGNYIDSLTIQTNKRTSPVFGGSGGKRDYRIEVPSGYQAVGFAGRSAKYLDAIGLITAPVTLRQETQIFGGRGGSVFSDRDIPAGARISEIRISSANYIDGIQAVYTLRDGRILEGQRHGGTGGRGDVFRRDFDIFHRLAVMDCRLYRALILVQHSNRTDQRQVFGVVPPRPDLAVEKRQIPRIGIHHIYGLPQALGIAVDFQYLSDSVVRHDRKTGRGAQMPPAGNRVHTRDPGRQRTPQGDRTSRPADARAWAADTARA